MSDFNLEDLCESCGWDSETIINSLAGMVEELQAEVVRLDGLVDAYVEMGR